MKSWLVWTGLCLGVASGALGCGGDDDDDDIGGDGDADADPNRECGTVEEEVPTCVPEGLDERPSRLEPGCGGLGSHSITFETLIKDTDARLHPDLGVPTIRAAVSAIDPLTFPIDDSLQFLVNGCEIAADRNVQYLWESENDAMNIVLTGGKYYAFELRERGAGGEGGARLFYRAALRMPDVIPNMLTPLEEETLPEQTGRTSLEVTWNPFDLDQLQLDGEVPTHQIELIGYIQTGGPNPLLADLNQLANIDGMSGSASFNAGTFELWDFIRMRVAYFDQPDISGVINVARRVN